MEFFSIKLVGMKLFGAVKRYFWGQSAFMQKVFLGSLLVFIFLFCLGYFIGKTNSKQKIPADKVSTSKFSMILEVQNYVLFNKNKMSSPSASVPGEENIIQLKADTNTSKASSTFYLNEETFKNWEAANQPNAIENSKIPLDLNQKIVESPQIRYQETTLKKGLKFFSAFKTSEEVKKGKNWKAFIVNSEDPTSGVALYNYPRSQKALLIELSNWANIKESIKKLKINNENFKTRKN